MQSSLLTCPTNFFAVSRAVFLNLWVPTPSGVNDLSQELLKTVLKAQRFTLQVANLQLRNNRNRVLERLLSGQEH